MIVFTAVLFRSLNDHLIDRPSMDEFVAIVLVSLLWRSCVLLGFGLASALRRRFQSITRKNCRPRAENPVTESREPSGPQPSTTRHLRFTLCEPTFSSPATTGPSPPRTMPTLARLQRNRPHSDHSAGGPLPHRHQIHGSRPASSAFCDQEFTNTP